MVLAVVVGIGATLFGTLVRPAGEITLTQAALTILAAIAVFGLAVFVQGVGGGGGFWGATDGWGGGGGDVGGACGGRGVTTLGGGNGCHRRHVGERRDTAGGACGWWDPQCGRGPHGTGGRSL